MRGSSGRQTLSISSDRRFSNRSSARVLRPGAGSHDSLLQTEDLEEPPSFAGLLKESWAYAVAPGLHFGPHTAQVGSAQSAGMAQRNLRLGISSGGSGNPAAVPAPGSSGTADGFGLRPIAAQIKPATPAQDCSAPRTSGADGSGRWCGRRRLRWYVARSLRCDGPWLSYPCR